MNSGFVSWVQRGLVVKHGGAFSLKTQIAINRSISDKLIPIQVFYLLKYNMNGNRMAG